MASKIKFRVNPAFLEAAGPAAFTQVNGRTVSLTGKDVTQKRAGGKDGPGTTTVIPAVTQADLKILHDQGNTWVEQETEADDAK